MQETHRAAALIADADALVIAAGAGMGVDSGLPDFRGVQGFWQAYPALRQAQIDFHSIASPGAFAADPGLAWGFYGHRLALYRNTRPHAGFALLRHWGGRMARGCHVFTSNVDGQFQQAGFEAARIHECHGSIHHLQCLAACSQHIWPADAFAPDVDEPACRLRNAAPRCPRCPRCGALARPNILMFGDWQWVERRSAAQDALQQAWLATTRRPVVIEIGAGTAIPSVRHFSRRVVQQHGGRLIRINPTEPAVPDGRDVALTMGGKAALEAIGQALGPDWCHLPMPGP